MAVAAIFVLFGSMPVFAETYTLTIEDDLGVLTSYAGTGDYTEEQTAAIKTEIASGKSWVGWAEKAGDGTLTALDAIEYPKDFSLELTEDRTFVPDQEYTITYNLNGGEFGATPVTSYRYSSEPFTIPVDVTMDGNTFLGWTGEGITTPSKDIQIPNGTAGDKTYTANWQYPVLKLKESTENLTKITTYNGTSVYRTYTNPTTSTYMVCVPGSKVVFTHDMQYRNWVYFDLDDHSHYLGNGGESCRFTVPLTASGLAILKTNRYASNNDLDYYYSSGWIKAEECFPTLEIPNSDDPYVKFDNIISFINTSISSSQQICLQGAGDGKIYVKSGSFTNNSNPNIASSGGTLIYDSTKAAPSTRAGNYRCAAHLANIMNFILYQKKGSGYGSVTALFTDTPATESDSHFTTLNETTIEKGFYAAFGGASNFYCNARDNTGLYNIKSVNSYYDYAVWW